MKHKLTQILIFLLLFIFNQSFSQGWLWNSQFSSTENVGSKGLCIDSENSVYSLVEFYDIVNFAGQNMTSFGDKDILLAKLDKFGNLEWIRQAGDVDIDAPTALVIDDSGNTFITGSFESDSYFDSNVLIDSRTLNSTNEKDIFLAKYDIDGNLVWTTNVGSGNSIQKGNGIALHSNGEISLLGFFDEEIDFGPTTITANGYRDQFYAKFDNKGDYISSTHFRSTSNVVSLNSINIDASNNIYISGLFSDTLFVGNDTLVSNGNRDIAVIKLNSSGSVLWTRSFGSNTDDRSYASVLDASGNVYVTGYFKGAMSVDTEDLTCNGGYDIFITKLSSSNNVLWAKSYGDSNDDNAIDIQLYNNSQLLISGSYSGSLDLNGVMSTSSSTNKDGFLGFINSSTGVAELGVPILTTSYEATDRLTDIVIDSEDNIYMSGDFKSDQIFFGGSTLTNTNSGVKDIFLSKYGCFDELVFTSEPVSCVDGMGIPYSNDGEATVTAVGGTGPYTYNWSNGETTQTITGLDVGTYSVTVSDVTSCSVSGSVIIDANSAVSSDLTYVKHITCDKADDGEITVTPFDGSPPYTYQWDGPGPYDATTQAITGLEEGDYSVTVTDDCGNTSESSVTIIEPAKINENATVNCTCTPFCVGSIELNPTGGTPPYTYIWDTGETTSIITDLCEGEFFFTITDANGCTKEKKKRVRKCKIRENAIIVCENPGMCNGSIELNPTDGIPPFTYLWDTGETTSMISGLCEGQYHFTITDFYGCTKEKKKKVRECKSSLSGILPSDISIYPNPASEKFNIDLSNIIIDVLEIEIIDITGQIVFYRKFEIGNEPFLNISTENLIDGIYYVRIKNNEDYINKKLIILK